MIFVSVGTQLPFERMLNLIESWVVKHNIEEKVIAQIGQSHFESHVIECYDKIEPSQFLEYLIDSSLVISHAGMGNVITCLENDKKAIFLARDYTLGEHRNNHQLDTCEAFSSKFENLTFCKDDKGFIHSLYEHSAQVGKADQKVGRALSGCKSGGNLKDFANNLTCAIEDMIK